MLLETFRGSELREVLARVRRALGDDAMLVRTQVTRRPGGHEVEVVAARAADVEQLRLRLDGARAAALRAEGRKRLGPYVLAMVGPSGAGKTTACMKVALSPAGVAHRKVGLLTLDTYRVGALDEIQTYAEIAELPVEVAYSADDALGALERLRDREVVLVDTPGRGYGAGSAEWVSALLALDPDEVHLVVPAGARPGVVRALARGLAGVAPTHVLLSKLDETPSDLPLAALADAAGLPARWVSAGPEVPSALLPAGPRILASVGLEAAEADRAALAAG